MARAAFIVASLCTAGVTLGQCPDQWLPVSAEFTTNGPVYALATWDPDGPGPMPEALIAAGDFTAAGSVAAQRIAQWDGAAWQPLGAGLDGRVYSLAVYGGRLIAAGRFTLAGGGPAMNAAAWDGSSWEPMDLPAFNGLSSVTVFGGRLYAAKGASFYGTIFPVYEWSGSAWQAFATPCPSATWVAHTRDWLVYGGDGWDAACIGAWSPAIGHMDLTTGTEGQYQFPVLYWLGGSGPWMVAYGYVGGPVVLWTGSGWARRGFDWGAGLHAIADYHGAAAIGGAFTQANGVTYNHICGWDGAALRPMEPGLAGPNSYVGALVVHNDRLVVGGAFSMAGGRPASNLALWGPAPVCYADCDCSGSSPALSAADFICFANKFAAGDAYANCDGSTMPPALNVADFICFLNRYAAGCP